jgi:retron-type reverse transcriptase
MELQAFLQTAWSDLRSRAPVGIDVLAACLSVQPSELSSIRRSYRRVTIPKRTGRPRILLVPEGELKRVQRLILRRLLERIPCHAAATGFRKGQSIVSNARVHSGSDVILGLDLQDFFQTTRASRVHALFKRIGWDEAAAALLTRLCTYEGGLPQGAPTSPCLSNLVNYRLDCRLSGLARKHGAVYSRYADDITFSFKIRIRSAIFDVLKMSIYIVGRHGYEIHDRKTRIRGAHQRQLVTGLVVNERVRLPRENRRLLRAVEHHLSVGAPISMSLDQLEGWRGLMQMVESDRP